MKKLLHYIIAVMIYIQAITMIAVWLYECFILHNQIIITSSIICVCLIIGNRILLKNK